MSAPGPESAQESALDALLASLRSMLEMLVITAFLLTFVVQPFRIPSPSMEPTMRVGDFLLVDKQSFAPSGVLDSVLPPAHVNRGDLAVFYYPVDPSRFLVKRVIGLPGDHLRLRGGHVLINDAPLTEPYAVYTAARPNGFRDEFPDLREADPNVDAQWWMELRRRITAGEIIIPAGQYFVMGDNRNESLDSRYWGFVPRSAIVGRPLIVTFSTARPNPAAQPGSALQSVSQGLAAGFRAIRILH